MRAMARNHTDRLTLKTVLDPAPILDTSMDILVASYSHLNRYSRAAAEADLVASHVR